MKQASHKKTDIWFHVCEVPRIVTFRETSSRIVIARELGQGRMESWCYVGTEFQSGKVKKFWRWRMIVIVV